ncbi:Sexual differentiation process protein [Lachnellula subtilissima]|uniref:Sexual differentiation process protein n=1 Tax=Lachnellula subtilissima TaxID=602034 RepID=A0A8H8RR36_9HELO|nr:Sexual differentiation process protein [Lachnellula subtilissima]
MVGKLRTPWSSRDGPDLGIDGISRSNSGTEVTPTSSEKKELDGQDVDITAAAEDLPKFAKTHQFDPNLPQERINILHDATTTGDVEAMKVAEAAFAEDSPYEEVKAAVRAIDGGEVANTVRAWILGMIFVTICSGLNMFLSMSWLYLGKDCADEGVQDIWL